MLTFTTQLPTATVLGADRARMSHGPAAKPVVRPAMSAPTSAAQGSTVSFAGSASRISGLDVTDANAPGCPPRQAPV